jgi:hypothetical protein
LRVWIRATNYPIRNGERLPKERAEYLSNLLDAFEREVVPWPSETKEDQDIGSLIVKIA